ncbi:MULTISPECIES: DUF6673 family protein [Eisenbergiella]|jgi:hypothetical protein|uniref:DUF6673 domain-containing protein n=1 Tax=Eisenbergiella massiliensis TaxID=1720294 RepID=A0A3E3HWH9_9FIRM|nr:MULTISPECIES: DUF6673 family protein [Eisenbergiella]RGE56186.1 hypothetical protein DXC51_25835 [Eisenbergiella massiliensis]DAN95591.1 MAG TPA: hypothetical protein [Caudoviricetes sp.]
MGEFFRELQVDNGLRKIKVNDEGEYIEVSVNDSTFFDRFADLLVWVGDKEKELKQYGDTHKADTLEDMEVVREVMRKRTQTYQECCQRLDVLFGEGCCRKVFGNVVPDDLLIMDFLEQLTPVIEELGKERNKNLSLKYNRSRKGAASTKRKTLPGSDV